MIDQDYAAIAAAQDFSTGIAVWRASHQSKSPAAHALRFNARARTLIPLMVVSILTLVDCALLSFALLPSANL
ncbi:hypothetical protein [Aestuariivirga litoralis]|uniref:hypothetical protein n=1 Tax=Aestuariivirga litoralis TaxID=2650924 RepID=UPI0018C504EC|nr:hypothetical protein [Aestuariivirga litoralis]MBG1233209.1 hypothetical protein [Aestuariivirga litoralis]